MSKFMFIGVIFVVTGISILLNAIFGFHLPIFRTILAIFFIYLGVHMLFGTYWKWDCHKMITSGSSSLFSNIDIKIKNEEEIKDFNIGFGKGVIDLTAIKIPMKTADIIINTIFGETEILINSSTPVKISSNAMFGEAKMPNRNSAAFGSIHYQSTSDSNNEKPHLKIHGNVIFGSLRFQIKD